MPNINMDENNDEITDSTDARLEFEVRQEAMQLQRIQAEINAMLVQARLYPGVTNAADQARAIQIERTLQSLRNEQTLIENPRFVNITPFGTGFPDASTVSAASGGLFAAPIPGPILPSSGSGLFMSTPASTPGVFPPDFWGTSLFGGPPNTDTYITLDTTDPPEEVN